MRVSVEAHPNASVARVELADTVLRVWVHAKAVDGQANAAIERTIAEALGLRNRQVRLVSGARTRHKTFDIDVANVDELRRRLTQSSGN